MQAKQMGSSLLEFAQLFEAAGNGPACVEFSGLASVIGQGGTKTVATITKKIHQHWKNSNRLAMHPAALKTLLEHAARTLESSKAPAPAKDYRALLTLFDGSDTCTTENFFSSLNQALNAPPPTKKPTKKAKPFDPIAMRAAADELTSLLSDNAGFDAAIKRLAAPRKFSNKELTAIAEVFLGFHRKYKSKKEIIEAIKNRQLQDAIQASKDRSIQEIAV